MNLVLNGIEESKQFSFVVKRQATRVGYNSISAIEETLAGRDNFIFTSETTVYLLMYSKRKKLC